MIDTEFLSEARQHLEKRAVALSSVAASPIIERLLSFSEIRAGGSIGDLSEWLKTALADLPGSSIVYRISARVESMTEICDAFLRFKAQRTHRLPRKNPVIDSQTLYVGSSFDGHKRLREQLFGAHSGTYALNLARWLPDMVGELNLEVCRFDRSVESAIIQDIEDALWRSSHPVFGRCGPR